MGSEEPAAAVQVTEVVPGELDVRTGDATYRVLVPAGVGVPGVGDEDLAGALVEELLSRGHRLPAVVDVSSVVSGDPGLLAAIERRVDADDACTQDRRAD